MRTTEQDRTDSFALLTQRFSDERGFYLKFLQKNKLHELTGWTFGPNQLKSSLSQKTVLRGIDSAYPFGQEKFVTVYAGFIMDFIADIRMGSETLGKWKSVKLDSIKRKAFFLNEGGVLALLLPKGNTFFSYLVLRSFPSLTDLVLIDLIRKPRLRYIQDVVSRYFPIKMNIFLHFRRC